VKKIRFLFIRLTAILLFTQTVRAGEIPAAGQSEWDCKLFRAYLDKDMPAWLSLVLSAERHAASREEVFRLTLAFYGYTAYLSGKNDKATARVYLKKLESYIVKLKSMQYIPSRVEAMEIGVIAFKMSLDPASAIREGPKLLKKINRAAGTYPDCPYLLTERGNADFHRPAVWGGSYKKATAHYRRAVEIFRNTSKDNECNWFYLNTLIQLHRAAKLAGMKKEQEEAEKLIRELAPGWKDHEQE